MEKQRLTEPKKFTTTYTTRNRSINSVAISALLPACYMCVFWLKVSKSHPMLGNPRPSWILDSTLWISDSSYWIPVFVSGSWFGIPILAGFRIPKPRISDSTSNVFLDSAIGIFFIHGAIHMILNQHHFLGVFKHLTILFYVHFQLQFRIDVT